MKNVLMLGLKLGLKHRSRLICFYKQRFNLLKHFFMGAWGGLFLFLWACDSGFKASELVQNYITISSPSPINRANMASYSLSGTCFYNEQPVTIHIKSQTGDSSSPPPNLSTCTNKEWSVNNLNLSDLSNGNVTIEVIHLNPSGKGYSVKEVVMKTSEGAAVSINRSHLPHITHGAANTYTLTGTCTEVDKDVIVEVSDGTNSSSFSSSQTSCEVASPVGDWSTSFDHSLLSEGTLTITVTHTSSTISDTVEIIKDVTPPSVTIANTAGERVSTETYALSGTCSELNEDVNVTLTDISSRKILQTASCTENSGSGPVGDCKF